MRSLRTWFWRRVLAYTDRRVLPGARGWRVRLRNHAWRKVCHRLCCDHVDYGDVCCGCPLRAAAVSREPSSDQGQSDLVVLPQLLAGR